MIKTEGNLDTKIEFLKWLKENKWCVYKDGTWYTLTDKNYVNYKSRKYYTEEEVIQKFNKNENNKNT